MKQPGWERVHSNRHMKELEPGDILDNFQVISKLRDSTVAHIYTARDVVYQDVVVLKLPLDNILANPELLYHHQNEERVAPILDHPSIIKYHLRLQSHQYLILEYVKGEPLKAVIKKNTRLSLTETLKICRQIADGIDYLHRQNIVHLDIKPENILVTPEAVVKIIDFGLAHIIGEEDVLGKDFRDPPGTPDYISPEQLCGVRTCPGSDIYSFGIMVYEMLTGSLPYPKTNDLNELRERLIKPPVPPRHYNEDIPPAVQEVILKAITANPDKRYQSAVEFIDRLAAYRSRTTSSIGELKRKPTSLLPLANSSHHYTGRNDKPGQERTPNQRHHILGCIAGSDNLDMIMAFIRQQALLNGSKITLLHVLEEDHSEYVKQALLREQEELSRKLDEAISTLKLIGLSPVLRIKKGKATEKILETARELRPDLLILGPPRPRMALSLMLHGSVLEKVAGAGVSNVTVATTVSSPQLPQLLDHEGITRQYVDQLELYFWDCWVTHLNSLTEVPRALSGIIENPEDHPLQDCPFSELLDSIGHLWPGHNLHSRLENCHHEFHTALDLMTDHTRHGYHDIVRNLYKHRAIPLSIEFKNLLIKVLAQLRSTAALTHLSFS